MSMEMVIMENLLTVLSTEVKVDRPCNIYGHSRKVAIQQFVIGTDDWKLWGSHQS